jgi:hypothetical protein
MKKVDLVGIVENMAMVGGPGGEQRYILYTGEMDQVVLESKRILIIFYLISLCRSGYSRWPEP